jgi:LysR family transcriptional regulator, hypochlorite-specific transcription factor HypT
MLSIVWLEDFRTLVSTGNFSQAAKERHMTQPAFSRRIRALEEWVGADLFDRSTQPARLTLVGSWFQEVADELLERIARVPGEAKSLAQSHAATLTIAATHALSLRFLPRWLRSLETGLTLGPVQLVSDVLERCEALMLKGEVQFVLSHAHPEVPGAMDVARYESANIGHDKLIPVSAPNALGQALHHLAPQAGALTAILGYTSESGLGRIVRAVLGKRLEPVATRCDFTAHLSSLLRTMALEGRGLAWLPETLVEDDIANGSLVAAAGVEWDIPLEIRLYHERAAKVEIAQRFWAVARA